MASYAQPAPPSRMSPAKLGIGVAVIGFIIYAVVTFGAAYNAVVPLDEAVNQKIAQVQVMLGRQSDLLPNLVSTVQASANFEKSTFDEVAAARSAVGAVAKLNPKDVANSPDLQKQVIEAQARMSAATVRVNAAVEAYPQLKSTALYQDLMVQIEGAQNRVVFARTEEQEAFVGYNTYVKHFPRNLMLGVLGFHAHAYYDAGPDAQHAPKLNFN